MTCCDFAERFVKANAAVFFDSPEKRRELMDHLYECQDCQKYIREIGPAVMQRCGPADKVAVAQVAIVDRGLPVTKVFKVDEVFVKEGQVCPFIPGPVFHNIEQLLAAFDRPEDLYVVAYGPNFQAVARKCDEPLIERKRKLTDQYIAQVAKRTGRGYGQLTTDDARWVMEQVDRALVESN